MNNVYMYMIINLITLLKTRNGVYNNNGEAEISAVLTNRTRIVYIYIYVYIQ